LGLGVDGRPRRRLVVDLEVGHVLDCIRLGGRVLDGSRYFVTLAPGSTGAPAKRKRA
jgi:hypothetical protein